MLIFKKIYDLQHYLSIARKKGQMVGFAPTMGALHAGHIQLILEAKKQCQVVVASIFVNPTQFNDPKDLEKYPRTPGKDLEMLLAAGCDAVFMPEVSEMYPPGKDLTLHLDFGPMDQVMEGEFRPGHFNGMATVVKRLLDIVQPHHLYMGQKDYQQLTIVRRMLYLLGAPIALEMVATMREPDGLAMSSRNMRLTPDMRAAAPVIYQVLSGVVERLQGGGATVTELEQSAMQALAEAGLRPEYVDVVDAYTLAPVAEWRPDTAAVVCAAAWAGEVRLIDNVVV